MGSKDRSVAKRHRPSWLAYIRRNIGTTFSISERAEAMLTLLFIAISAGLATAGSFTASEISNQLEGWNLRIAIGFVIYISLQFGFFTPMRMWRDAIWVANIEKLLDEIWDLHDQGVILLNAHVDWLRRTPRDDRTDDTMTVWRGDWIVQGHLWQKECDIKLKDLQPLEARRFRNVVVVYPTLLGGLDDVHDHYRNMLLRRLDILQGVIDRYQPVLGAS